MKELKSRWESFWNVEKYLNLNRRKSTSFCHFKWKGSLSAWSYAWSNLPGRPLQPVISLSSPKMSSPFFLPQKTHASDTDNLNSCIQTPFPWELSWHAKAQHAKPQGLASLHSYQQICWIYVDTIFHYFFCKEVR